jgi:hypothetical protein
MSLFLAEEIIAEDYKDISHQLQIGIQPAKYSDGGDHGSQL